MKTLYIALTLGTLLAACGSAAPPPVEEEVSATWTSGDDDPLEQPEGESE